MTDKENVVNALEQCSICNSDTVIDAIDLIERISAELEQVKLERDAAINDLNLTRDCDTCKSKVEPYDIAYDMCDKCDVNRMNTRRISYCWRGMCEENSNTNNNYE